MFDLKNEKPKKKKKKKLEENVSDGTILLKLPRRKRTK